MIVGILLDELKKRIGTVAMGVVSTLSLLAIVGWAQGHRPAWSLEWVCERLGFHQVLSGSTALSWLHQADRRPLGVAVCIVGGLLASGSALHRGPLRQGVGAVGAWALIVPAAEVFGLAASFMWALTSFGVVVAIAALFGVFGGQWSRAGVIDALRENAAYFLLVPLMVPMMSGWLLRAYSDDRGMPGGVAQPARQP